MSLYNEIMVQVQKDKGTLPLQISFRDNPIDNLEPEASVAQWANGFKTGYFRLEKMWKGYIPKEVEEQFGFQLTTLFFFSSKSMANSMYEKVENKEVTWDSMVENMMKLFPDAMNNIAHLSNSIHQALATRGNPNQQPVSQGNKTVSKVGRNEPCSCGSGKKFKKCCGATHH